MNTANIIVIADEQRLRAQIETHLRELGDDAFRVRFFSNAEEFKNKYLEIKEEPPHPLSALPELKTYPRETLNGFLQLKGTSQVAIPQPLIRLKISKMTEKIEVLEPQLDSNQTLFATFPEDLMAETNAIEKRLSPSLVSYWRKFLQDINLETKEMTVPLQIENGQVAWIKFKGRSTASHWLIDVSDVSGKINPAIEKELARQAQHEEDTEELQLLSEIHVLIFKMDLLPEKPPVWVENTYRALHQRGFFPKESITRFIGLKYEDDGHTKLDVMHPRMEDLFYLPLDRLIFLQKMEIILGLPGKVTPSYLFSQDAHNPIEISKITRLEYLSDVALVVRNPVPLVAGLLAHFYLTLPGSNTPLSFWGKCLKSVPHPELEGQHLTTYSYFGLERPQLTALRQHLGSSTHYQSFVDSDPNHFRLNPDDLFVSAEDREPKQLVCFDLDEEASKQLSANLTRDIDLLQIYTSPSLAAFMADHFTQDKTPFPMSLAPGPEDFPLPQVSFTLKAETLELVNLSTPWEETTPWLGYSVQDAFAQARAWQSLFFFHPKQREVFEEACRLTQTNHRATHRTLVALAKDGRYLNVSVDFRPSESEGQLELRLKAGEATAITGTATKKLDRPVSVIILDMDMMTGDLNSFLEYFQAQLTTNNLAASGKVPVILTASRPLSQDRIKLLSGLSIRGLFLKPIDQRALSYLVTQLLKTPYSLLKEDNIGWLKMGAPIHVAREAELASLSEFGATIRLSRPLAPGTLLYLRGGIFDNAPNQCLAARFYHCEEDDSTPGAYLCSAIYYGINDAFMKFARRWFRETYAASKQESN